MSSKRSARLASLGTIGAVFGVAAVSGAVPAHATTTASVDNSRDGWDSQESGLSPANVVSSDFGQLFSTQLDGQVYAQPIVVPAANGRTSSVLVAVTENNTVYGLDPASGAILWSRHVGPTWPVSDIGCSDLAPNMGATATPVYDAATDTVYFTAKENDGATIKTPDWYMYAVDPGSGNDRHARTLIQGSPTNFAGTSFNAYYEGGRPGLLLLDGVVYAAFGSICDLGPYRGYVAGVDATSGQMSTLWTTENNGTYSGGGIWMGGGGIMSDGDGRLFVSTGNGISPAAGAGQTPPGNLAESVIRLQVNGDKSLSAADFFSPANASTLDLNDMDLGSGGTVSLPDSFGAGTSTPHLMVQVGKDGRMFLLNRDNLGGRAQGAGGTDAAVQVVGPYDGVWGHPAAWSGDGSGGYVYTVGNGDVLRAFAAGKDGNNHPTLTLAGTSTANFWYTSGSPVVTSDGNTPGSGTVWVVNSSGGNGANSMLTAYNADPDSTGTMQLIGQWPVGTSAKFAIAGTDSNRVYIGTRDGTILGFGRPATSALAGPSTDFGQVPLNTPKLLNATVTAHQNVTINSLTMSNAMFTTPALTAPISLTTGQTYSFPVTFTPTAAGSTWGILTANATVNGTAGKYSVGLSGNGTHQGLGAAPASVNFTPKDAQPTGTTVTVGVRINNTGTTPETLGSIGLTNDATSAFSVSGAPASGTVIQPQTGVDISVSYSPSVAGTQTGSITVPDGDGTLTIPLTGTSINAVHSISVTPWPLDFGAVPVGQSKTETFVVTNTGNVDATLTKAKAPIGGEFSVAAPINEGTVLGVGQTLDVDVTFTPTAAGAASDQYTITADTGQGVMYLPLTGTTPSEFTASPSPVSFPVGGGAAQPVGTTTTTTVHVTNNGTVPETVTGSTGPSASGPFAVTGIPAANTVVQPGAGFDLSVSYDPSAAGTQTDSVVIDDAGAPLTIPLSGTAVADVNDVTVSPSPVDFGGVIIGQSKTETVTVTNHGNVPSTITGVTAPAGGFAVASPNPAGTVLGVGQSVSLNLTFTPTAAGPVSGQYSITTSTGQGTVPLSVTGTGATLLVQRVSGPSRYDTGVAVSQQHWADAAGDNTGRTVAKTVVLARGDVAADALAGVPLAAYAQGPLLLTSSTVLPQVTLTEIQRVLGDSGTVDILGGSGAVSPGIQAQLQGLGYTVNRYSGSDRYATAMDIAVRGLNSPAHVIVATGNGFADALSAGPLAAGPAASGGVPAAIVLSNDGQLPQAVADYVRARSAAAGGAANAVYAVGGQAAQAVASLGNVADTTLSGADRYATNAAVVAQFRNAGPVTQIDVATGSDFPDALTGGALAATTGAVLVTVPSVAMTPSVYQTLFELRSAVQTVEIFGGRGAVGPAVAQSVADAVGGAVAQP